MQTVCLDNIMWEHDANPIKLSRIGNIIRVKETFPISESNIVVIPAVQGTNIVSGRSESPVLHLNEVSHRFNHIFSNALIISQQDRKFS